MSTVKNNSFQDQYGNKILAADVNAKFTDMETATQNIDADNVRNEGIDRINITGTPVLKALAYSYNNYRNASAGGFQYTFTTNDNNGAGQDSLHQLTHTGTDGENVLYLSSDGTASGAPVTYAAGDLIRIKFGFNFWGDTTNFDSQDSVIPQTQSGAFIIFPAHTTTAGGAFQAFPQGIDWLQYGLTGPEYNTTTNTGQTYTCPSSDDPSTVDRTRDDGIAVITTDGFFDSVGGIQIKEIQAHGSLNLILTSQLTIHTVGFFIVGPLYFHDTAPFSGGGRGWEIITDNGANYLARVERGNFMATVMGKGRGTAS